MPLQEGLGVGVDRKHIFNEYYKAGTNINDDRERAAFCISVSEGRIKTWG